MQHRMLSTNSRPHKVPVQPTPPAVITTHSLGATALLLEDPWLRDSALQLKGVLVNTFLSLILPSPFSLLANSWDYDLKSNLSFSKKRPDLELKDGGLGSMREDGRVLT